MSKKDWRHVGAVTVKSARSIYDYRYRAWVKNDRHFDSLREAVAWIGVDSTKLKYGHLAYYWHIPERHLPVSLGRGDEYVVIDEHGLVVPPWRVAQEWWQLPRAYHYYRSWRRNKDPFKYRNGPVSGTAKRWRGGRSSKHPKTFKTVKAELHFWQDDETHFYNIRRRHKNIRLPGSWDDYADRRIHFDYKCWKNYRKHQWKDYETKRNSD